MNPSLKRTGRVGVSAGAGIAIANMIPPVGNIPPEVWQILIPAVLSGLSKLIRDKWPDIGKYLPI